MSNRRSKEKSDASPVDQMLNWCNSHLSDFGLEASDLRKDFSDGSNMCRIIESITQQPFPMLWISNPKTSHEKRKNIGGVLTFLKNYRYLKPAVVKSDDILWGNVASIYTTLRTINIYLDHGHLPPYSSKASNKQIQKEEEPLQEEQVEQNENEEQEQPNTANVVGIDLGTTFCRYSVFQNDNSENSGPKNVIESAVVFDGNEKIVGVVPISLNENEETVIITAIKRIIGRDFSDPSLQPLLDTLPYKVIEDPKTGRPLAEVQLNGETKYYSFEELTAMLLSRIKELVSEQMGHEITDAVISVPAYFNGAQRQATMDAGRIAGLNVLRIVNETLATTASYALKDYTKNQNSGDVSSQKVVVYDFGGGKLDVSLMNIENGDCSIIKTAGFPNLGGTDFDCYLVRKIVEDFKEKTGADPTKSSVAMHNLTREAEKAKIRLSTEKETDIIIPNFYNNFDLRYHLTREEFEAICDDLFKKCETPLHELFDDTSNKDDVKTVILSGGCTKIPKVQSILKEFFGDNVEFNYADEDDAVARGVAMQGAIIKGDFQGISITDAVTLSLGVSSVNGALSVIIPRGTKLPATNKIMATTSKDNQKNVGFDILEGERPMAADNIKLGHVTIDGIQQAPRGVPQIEITMTLNENGILVVVGKDLTTNASVTATVEKKSNMSAEDIQRILDEAESQKDQDQIAKKTAEAKTELQCFIERAEGVVNDQSKISSLSKNDVDTLKLYISEMKEWFEANQNASSSAYQKKYNEFYYNLNEIMRIH